MDMTTTIMATVIIIPMILGAWSIFGLLCFYDERSKGKTKSIRHYILGGPLVWVDLFLKYIIFGYIILPIFKWFKEMFYKL